jgi:SAM-dependent methyltransferase
MNWRAKALLQRTCASLPFVRDDLYYTLQRAHGAVYRHDPMIWLRQAAAMVEQLAGAGLAMPGARVMEVGTGMRLDLPLGFYLGGAAQIVTVDLHRLLRPELVADSLAFIRQHLDAIRALFAGVVAPRTLEDRLTALAEVTELSDVLRLANIIYRAPEDATRVDMPDGSIDAHVSFTVFEHIAEDVLVGILREAGRLLGPSGLALHHIDLSDHFSHSDRSISEINFLRFSPAQWTKYAGNRFAYHNRLRAPAYRRIYAAGRHQILDWHPTLSQQSLSVLAEGFPLASEYRHMPAEDLCISHLRILSRPLR